MSSAEAVELTEPTDSTGLADTARALADGRTTSTHAGVRRPRTDRGEPEHPQRLPAWCVPTAALAEADGSGPAARGR